MTVYLFEDAHYNEVEHLDVYASDAAALAAHPPPPGAEWVRTGEPGYWRMKGLGRGQHRTITPTEVKS